MLVPVWKAENFLVDKRICFFAFLFKAAQLDKAANVRKLIINYTDLVIKYTLLGYLIQSLGDPVKHESAIDQFHPFGFERVQEGNKTPRIQ